MNQRPDLVEHSRPFLESLEDWYQSLPSVDMKEVLSNPAQAAILCVDLTQGFAYEGSLASPRVAAIVPPIVALFRRAHDLGVRHFLLPQDQHPEGAVEFSAFPPHSVAGTDEARTVPELLDQPFSDLFQIFPKNSINAFLATELGAWVTAHPEVDTYVVVGDCTDLCVYQLAMHLRLQANARGLDREVIVPANCVDTYHTSVELARELGGLPHDGDLMHRLFLQHMALNRVEVVRELSG